MMKVQMIIGWASKLKALFFHDNVTGGVALASVISPAWLPYLTEMSSFAALLAPILGVLWLAVQIYSKIKEQPK
jgi:hypothetical protein